MQYNGLTSAQAEAARSKGENRLQEEKKAGIAGLFFSQFKDMMILILAVATLVSAWMGETAEAITIIAIVLLNAVMGFLQEYKTEKTLEALRSMTAPSARLLRDGRQQLLPATEVVCGDVALLRAGDRVPADGVLLEAESLNVDESLLTGESDAVDKTEGQRICMGTMVCGGTAVMRVDAVGMQTEMGRIASIMQNTHQEKTPLQKRLQQLGKVVAVGCIVICMGVSFIGWLQGDFLLETLLSGISLAVAAIPEGMPAIVTVVLALSVGRILKKGAIIRRLPAVETLGCAGVICSDKTGTITQNRMTLNSFYCNGELMEKGGLRKSGDPALNRLLRCMVLCNDAQLQRENGKYRIQGTATEAALLQAALENGRTAEEVQRSFRRTSAEPFDSTKKRMSVVVQKGTEESLFLCKGAPDILLRLCTRIVDKGAVRNLTPDDRRRITAAIQSMAQQGCRVLAFAENECAQHGENGMILLGMASLYDPPKPQVEDAVRRCRQAGMRPVMITGDHPQTARAIAEKVGIWQKGDRVVTGEELDGMPDAALEKECMGISVYARVTPGHKLRIVKAYQQRGQVVAMTGDGVNDAPAIKQADIGIAMNSGTDVTKQAAEVILLDDNFATIVSTVEEGRVIYQNIRHFIRYLLTGNLGEVLSMLFSMLLGLPMALSPIQILMVNLLTDGLPAIALGMEKPTPDILRKPPRPKNEKLFAGGLLRIILVRGLFLGIATAGTYYAVWRMSASLDVAQSAAFITLVLAQMVHIFECRGRNFSLRGNPILLAAAGTSIGVTLLSVYLPAAQKIFGTVFVGGLDLLPILIGILIGPLGTALLRWIKRVFS